MGTGISDAAARRPAGGLDVCPGKTSRNTRIRVTLLISLPYGSLYVLNFVAGRALVTAQEPTLSAALPFRHDIHARSLATN